MDLNSLVISLTSDIYPTIDDDGNIFWKINMVSLPTKITKRLLSRKCQRKHLLGNYLVRLMSLQTMVLLMSSSLFVRSFVYTPVYDKKNVKNVKGYISQKRVEYNNKDEYNILKSFNDENT